MPKTPVVKTININPSIIALKPRQVLLAKPNMNISKASVSVLKPERKALLLWSIAGYLKSNGFSKTLKKFLSEARLEGDDISVSSLDLDHMCFKYLETCDHGSTNLSSQKVQDIHVDGNSKRGEEADIVADVETVSKKKKKKDDEDNYAVVMHSEDNAKLTDSNEAEKLKSKGKSKKMPDSLIKTAQVSVDVVKKSATDVVSDSHLSQPDKKHKDKKKKKGKLDSKSPLSNVERVGTEDEQGTKANESKSFGDLQATETTIMNSTNISVEDGSVKSKDKKKKKDNSSSKILPNGDSKEIDEQQSGGRESKNEGDNACEEDATDKKRKDSKKRKRSVSEENNSEPIDKKELEESKRRKTEGSEKLKGSGQITEMNALVGTNGHSVKEVKGESHKVNVNVEKNGERSAPNKSLKKQANGSAEPKTVKAFQRVKVDEVVFTDEKLKDNSYWAKDGAESGYGAKAQEVLGQVRGRNFRHEKTKKKRGSYRGGQIDLHSHSVKFNYSDDE